MWRSILALILLPALAAAQNPESGAPAVPQSESHPAAPTNSSRDLGRTSGPTYQTYTFHNAIRRGRQEEVAIRLSPQGLVTSPRSPVSGIVPLKLDLQPVDGLTIGAFRYPKGLRRNVKFQVEPVAVSWWPEIFFKIRADEAVALGQHTLRGKLTFQVINYSGTNVGPVQQLAVQIPITVVEHDAKVQRADWPENRLSPGMIILIIVLLPVEIPVVILYYSVCALEGSRNCPD